MSGEETTPSVAETYQEIKEASSAQAGSGEAPEEAKVETRKRRKRERKDVPCQKCGKMYSSNTRHHKCTPQAPPEEPPPPPPPSPKSEEKPEPSEELPIAPKPKRSSRSRSKLPRPPPVPIEARRVTLDEVRSFLVEDRQRHRESKRGVWLGALF